MVDAAVAADAAHNDDDNGGDDDDDDENTKEQEHAHLLQHHQACNSRTFFTGHKTTYLKSKRAHSSTMRMEQSKFTCGPCATSADASVLLGGGNFPGEHLAPIVEGRVDKQVIHVGPPLRMSNDDGSPRSTVGAYSFPIHTHTRTREAPACPPCVLCSAHTPRTKS